tara:strand:+ start:81 stop:470 length:390 start_codon:yes stop_codon:yes gene_type:complete
MITEKIFKNIILTQVALIAALFCLVIAEGVTSPIDEDLSFNLIDSVFLIWFIGYIISIILLYKFKSLGKKLFVLIFILGFITSLFEGQDSFTIEFSSFTPIISAIENLLYVVDGIILATLYFTSIKGKF